MAISSPIDQTPAQETAELGRRARWLAAVRDFARHRTLGAVGAVVVLVMLVLAVFAGGLAPYDPVAVDFGAMLAAPNATHWLGTDAFGRDVLSRLIYCSRTALLVGFVAALLGATLRGILGLARAYFGGLVGLYLQRPMDTFLSFPLVILALALVAILGNSIPNV